MCISNYYLSQCEPLWIYSDWFVQCFVLFIALFILDLRNLGLFFFLTYSTFFFYPSEGRITITYFRPHLTHLLSVALVISFNHFSILYWEQFLRSTYKLTFSSGLHLAVKQADFYFFLKFQIYVSQFYNFHFFLFKLFYPITNIYGLFFILQLLI